ncbi:putative adenylate kinase 3 [Zopfochytrium polystomum]|nr:putative adenylate kinase 3 [Zopfochytrium polystomum]
MAPTAAAAVAARSMRTFLIMGCPGSGKGTLSKRIANTFNVKTLSSGDILRHHIQQGTELGKRVTATLASGGLVDDAIMVDLMHHELIDHVHGGHVLLDGFPRTVGQARDLAEFLPKVKRRLDAVVSLDVPEEVILDRIDGRWIHAPSGRTYNMSFNPPKVPGCDDITGEPLTKRPDDTREVFGERLRQYHAITEPLLEYYRETGLLQVHTGSTSNELFPKIKAGLEPLF